MPTWRKPPTPHSVPLDVLWLDIYKIIRHKSSSPDCISYNDCISRPEDCLSCRQDIKPPLKLKLIPLTPQTQHSTTNETGCQTEAFINIERQICPTTPKQNCPAWYMHSELWASRSFCCWRRGRRPPALSGQGRWATQTQGRWWERLGYSTTLWWRDRVPQDPYGHIAPVTGWLVNNSLQYSNKTTSYLA